MVFMAVVSTSLNMVTVMTVVIADDIEVEMALVVLALMMEATVRSTPQHLLHHIAKIMHHICNDACISATTVMKSTAERK